MLKDCYLVHLGRHKVVGGFVSPMGMCVCVVGGIPIESDHSAAIVRPLMVIMGSAEFSTAENNAD